MSSPNSRAVYLNRYANGPRAAELRRNMRLKKLEAYATIPRDTRAPEVVKEADRLLQQQEREMGDGDHEQNTGGTEPAAGDEPDGRQREEALDWRFDEVAEPAPEGPDPAGSAPGHAGAQAELQLLNEPELKLDF